MSTVVARVRLVELIYDSFNGKFYSLCVFVDLSKAFDTVNHENLLHKIFLYGIRGKLLYLIDRYLHNRVQRVGLDAVCSDVRNINIGVPQGSILGPLLF